MSRPRRAHGLISGLWLAILAAVVAGPTQADPLHAVCMTDSPLLSPGERAVVTAVTDAPAGAEIRISWSADGGAIIPTGGPDETRWAPPEHVLGLFVIRAHVQSGPADAETADCGVEIAVVETPNRGGGQTLLSTRALLTPTAREEPGYGLYSYVLFGVRPATDAEIELFDAILKSYLSRLRTLDAQENHPQWFPRAQQNRTYVPVRQARPDNFEDRALDDEVAWIRNHYDYDKAFDFLARLRALKDADPALSDGTVWIVSCQHPLGGTEDPSPGFQQNLSAVPVRFIERWMQIFASQAAQPRDYNRYSVALLQLDLRIAIYRTAGGLEAVSAAIKTLGGAK